VAESDGCCRGHRAAEYPAVLCFVSLGRWMLRLLWPVYARFAREDFDGVFNSLLPWQKIKLYVGSFFLLLYAFVLVLWALL
jgi:hypothetical protein